MKETNLNKNMKTKKIKCGDVEITVPYSEVDAFYFRKQKAEQLWKKERVHLPKIFIVPDRKEVIKVINDIEYLLTRLSSHKDLREVEHTVYTNVWRDYNNWQYKIVEISEKEYGEIIREYMDVIELQEAIKNLTIAISCSDDKTQIKSMQDNDKCFTIYTASQNMINEYKCNDTSYGKFTIMRSMWIDANNLTKNELYSIYGSERQLVNKNYIEGTEITAKEYQDVKALMLWYEKCKEKLNKHFEEKSADK